MHTNLPIPAVAANLAIETRQDDECFSAYPWQAVRIIAAELDRFAQAAQDTVNPDPRRSRPDGYTQGFRDCKAVLLDMLRGRDVVLDAVTDRGVLEDPAATGGKATPEGVSGNDRQVPAVRQDRRRAQHPRLARQQSRLPQLRSAPARGHESYR
jgi:hypothetical protein